MGAKNSHERRMDRSRIQRKEADGLTVSKNIIIFGETGVGKSSVVNMLVRSKVAKVSDAALGCTFEYSLHPFEDYVFYDTVGLNEGKAGLANNKKSTNMLIKLIKSLEGGINLLVLVMKKGRITETVHNNYKLFVEVMTKNEVPVILVVTHCETSQTMNKWWADNNNTFSDKYKMKITDCLCICSSDGEGSDASMAASMKKKFDESGTKLMDLIDRHVLEVGWSHEDFINWGLLLVKTFLHRISEEEGALSYWPELKEWFKTVFNLSDEEATRRSNNIFFDDQESSDTE